MPLDVDNGAVIRTESDCWNSEEIALRLCRGNRTGIAEQQHQICMKIHNSSASNCYLKFKVHQSGGAATTSVIDVLTMFGDGNSTFDGNVTVNGIVYATAYSNTSDQSVKDNIQDIDLTPIFDNCNVKSYDRNDKPELGKRVGFIATYQTHLIMK